MYIPPASQGIDNWQQKSAMALFLFTNAYQFWKDFIGGPGEFCRYSGSASGKA